MRSWHLKPRASSKNMKADEVGGFACGARWSRLTGGFAWCSAGRTGPAAEGSRGEGAGAGGATCKSDFIICEQEQLRDAALSHQTHKLLGFVHSAAAGQTLQPLLRCATRCSSERSVWKLASRHEKHQRRGSDRQTKLRCQSGLRFIGLSAICAN